MEIELIERVAETKEKKFTKAAQQGRKDTIRNARYCAI